MGAKLAEASAAATDAAPTGAEHALKQTSVGEAALRAENEQLLRRLTAAMEELRVAMDSAAQAHSERRVSREAVELALAEVVTHEGAPALAASPPARRRRASAAWCGP